MNILHRQSGKLPMVVIIVVALVVCVVGGAFTFLKVSKKPGDAKLKHKKQELASWKLEEFIVNLADSEESRYLKVNMVLEIEGEKPSSGGGHGGGEGESAGEAMARDIIIDVLTRKGYHELQSADGKSALKAELKSALNSSIEDCKVVNIYFTSFAMQ